MLLTLSERFVLIGILPTESTFLTMKRLRELREALAPDEAEQKELSIEDVKDADGKSTGRLAWPSASSTIKREIDVGETMTDLIVTTLKKLDSDSKLTVNHLSLYEKFVERKGQEDTCDQPSRS